MTLAETEQLTSDFFETDLGAPTRVRADDALERLRRLGLVHREVPPSPTDGSSVGSSTPPRGRGGAPPTALPPLRQPDYESYSAVAVPEALAILRRVWGEHGRGAAGYAPAPSLDRLTAPITPGGGRRRALEESHSPMTPSYPMHSTFAASRDLTI